MNVVVALVLFLLTSTSSWARDLSKEECLQMATKSLQSGAVLFAYSTQKSLVALAILKNKEFINSDGQEFHKVNRMYDLSGKQYSVNLSANYTRLGTDRCVWFAENSNLPDAMTVYSSVPGKLSVPSSNQQTLFFSLNKTCIDQGDWPEDKKPPCKKPVLVATSDLNQNGRPEFWYVDPYMWNDGFAIDELDVSGNQLKKIVSKCMDCD